MNILDQEYEKSLPFDAATEERAGATHYARVRLVKTYVVDVFVPLGGVWNISPDSDDDEIIAFAQDILINDVNWGPNVKVDSGATDLASMEDVWEY